MFYLAQRYSLCFMLTLWLQIYVRLKRLSRFLSFLVNLSNILSAYSCSNALSECISPAYISVLGRLISPRDSRFTDINFDIQRLQINRPSIKNNHQYKCQTQISVPGSQNCGLGSYGFSWDYITMINIVSKQHFESIDQFEFEFEQGKNTIGTGSFGVVKLALHKGSNKLYAIKIIDLKKVSSEAELKIIEREIELHSALDHPHIIKIWDTLIRDNVVYMIMECAQRGNLFYHQNGKSRFTEPQAFQYFYQCCLAIDYLHRNNIMHRDIKPENLLLDHSLNIKLCDFGWSAVDIHAKRTTFCGTYQYMAPEMILKLQYDYRIDIWGIGILLFEMLHGFAPFRGASMEAVSTEIQKGQYHIHPTLSEDLKNLIRCILQFDPVKRPSMKELFGHPWVTRMKLTVNSYLKKTELTLATIVPLKLMKMKLEECPALPIKKKTHRKAESVSHMPSNRPSVGKDKKSIQINFEINNYELVQSMNPSNKKLTNRCKTMTEESIKRLGHQLFSKGMTQSHQSPQTKKPKKTTHTLASKFKVQHARFNTEFSETIKAQRKKKSIDDAVCKLSKKYLAHVRGSSRG